MRDREDISRERKGQILDAATAVFAEKGFHKARMDDIVAHAGLSKGALYWYFKSKDELIAAILSRFFDREMADLEAVADQPGSVGDRLIELTRYISDELRRLTRLLPITFEFYAVAARQRGVQLALKGYFSRYRALLARMVQGGIDQGEFRPVSADDVGVAIIALYEGLMLLMVVDPETVDWGALSEKAIEFLIDGIRSRG